MVERVRTVLVLNGPGVEFRTDLDSLEARCKQWGAARGLEVSAARARDDRSLVEALEAVSADALVVNPGTTTPAALRGAMVGRSAVHVSLGDLEPERFLDGLVIWGRGEGAYDWALRHLAASAFPWMTLRYGPEPDQVGDLRVPDGPGPHPVAVLLHGGFWRDQWRRDLMDGLAVHLARGGFATWNVEYRRIAPGGAWPATLLDVADGIDYLAGRRDLKLDRISVLGHSAGGHLALWGAARGSFPGDVPGGLPAVLPARVFALAPVADLVSAETLGLDDHATAEFLRGPVEHRVKYRLASPMELVPLRVPQVVVHGSADGLVPVEMSRRYVERARNAGDEVVYLELPGGDHMSLIDPDSEAWAIVEELLGER